MIFNIIEIIVSSLLIIVILLQQRGTGLGAAFGGEGGFYRTRLGIEKILMISTIVLSITFFVLAILNIVF